MLSRDIKKKIVYNIVTLRGILRIEIALNVPVELGAVSVAQWADNGSMKI